MSDIDVGIQPKRTRRRRRTGADPELPPEVPEVAPEAPVEVVPEPVPETEEPVPEPPVEDIVAEVPEPSGIHEPPEIHEPPVFPEETAFLAVHRVLEGRVSRDTPTLLRVARRHYLVDIAGPDLEAAWAEARRVDPSFTPSEFLSAVMGVTGPHRVCRTVSLMYL